MATIPGKKGHMKMAIKLRGADRAFVVESSCVVVLACQDTSRAPTLASSCIHRDDTFLILPSSPSSNEFELLQPDPLYSKYCHISVLIWQRYHRLTLAQTLGSSRSPVHNKRADACFQCLSLLSDNPTPCSESLGIARNRSESLGIARL